MVKKVIQQPVPRVVVQDLSVEFWGITDAVRWNTTAPVGIPDGDYTFGFIRREDWMVCSVPDAWLSIKDGIFADYREICSHAGCALISIGHDSGDYVVKGPIDMHCDGTVLSFFILPLDEALELLREAA